MTKNKNDQDDEAESFRQAMWFNNAVEMLCHSITNWHHDNPDPEMAITVDVATTDAAAIKRGWPSAEVMRKAVKRALEYLPKNITERIELQEIHEFSDRKAKTERNDLCPCGSGKKYKKCCGGH